MAVAENGAEPKKRGFALPSAYTILFALIVIIGVPDLPDPGRDATSSTRTASRSRARTTRSSRPRSGSSSTR